jgi:hypothetical protein
VKKELTQSIAKDLFSYDEKKGVFTRLQSCRKYKSGTKIIGAKDKQGYLRTKALGKYVFLHRLAWLFVYGEMPYGPIDHRDGVRTNNAIDNLRVVSVAENTQNSLSDGSNNKNGFCGVYYDKNKALYRASIMAFRKRKSLGYFSTAQEAHCAYVKAKNELHLAYVSGVGVKAVAGRALVVS